MHKDVIQGTLLGTVSSNLMLPKPLKTGRVGLEIEVEGVRLPKNELFPDKFWEFHADGSLRGESGEYVLKEPIGINLLPEALDLLGKKFEDCKSVINESHRTSVHVHINCLKYNQQQIYQIITAFMILENILVQWCGKDRVGNLFCLRSSDAEYLVFLLRNTIQGGRFLFAGDINDNVRYSAMNLLALYKYGSLEFRSLRGTTDPKIINDWTQALNRMVGRAAENFNSPRSIVDFYFEYGHDLFIEHFVGKNFADDIRERVPDGYKSMMDQGSEYAIEIASATNYWVDLAEHFAKPQPEQMKMRGKAPRPAQNHVNMVFRHRVENLVLENAEDVNGIVPLEAIRERAPANLNAFIARVEHQNPEENV